VVRPRGTSMNYERHVRAEHVLADVTSWTRSEAVARRFACGGGIILVLEEDDVIDRIVPHPFPFPYRYAHEQEVLIRGLLENIHRIS
jgi:hypothetical protein